jgi:serine/threonine protein phosphatase PrpC
MAAIRFTHVVEVVAARGAGQDRARVVERDNGLVIALADGAGGTGNGAMAAEAIIEAVGGAAGGGGDWAELLAELDHDGKRLAGGQSTAVILSIDASGLVGASVGDSGAWMIAESEVVDLTDGQTRKPLVGDGCIPFRTTAPPLGHRTLLVASDGLLRYAKQHDIARIANGPDLAAAARALVNLVRLPSGGLQDDVSIVLCRQLP